MDAVDGQDLGVSGLPHAPHPLHPHQEAYPSSGEDLSESKKTYGDQGPRWFVAYVLCT